MFVNIIQQLLRYVLMNSTRPEISCVHARAGDRAAAAGERGLLASDLLSELRAILNS